jgi:hypothetical protein
MVHNRLVDAPTDPAVSAWLTRFVERTLSAPEFERIVTLLGDRIATSIEDVARDAGLRRGLDESTRGQLRAFMAALVADSPDLKTPAEAVEFARSIARSGLELGVLLQVYRTGQQAALDFVTDVVAHSDIAVALQPAALIAVWRLTTEWFNLSVERLIVAFDEERERWLRSALRRRREVVDAIRHGQRIAVDEATELLGHPLRAVQTALVLWSDGPTGEVDGLDELEVAAGRIAARLSAPRPLAMPAGAQELWAWIATEEQPDLDRLARSGGPLGPGVRAAVGSPARGVAGFRTSHRDAMAAKQLALAAPDTTRLVCYPAVELVSLMSGDLDALRTFVARELGALTAPDPAGERLRATALAYLSGGVNAAAGQLNVHRNTVRYRLRQVGELLGHDIDARPTQTELALRCAAVYGPAVLPAEDDTGR